MEKIWLSSYPQNMPAEIPANPYSSLVEMFEESFKKYGDELAFDNFGETLTYKAYRTLSWQFASYLQQHLGHKKGDRIAIMLPNTLQYPVALLGILLIGAIVVNINPLYTARELEYQLRDSGATTIIVMENFAATLQQCLANTPIKNVIVTQLGDLFPVIKRYLMNFVVRKIKKLVPAWHIKNTVPFNKALKQGVKKIVQQVPLTCDDLAFLQYTGGTTGVSKGAELTHGNMIANVFQAAAWIGAYTDPADKQIVISPLPLYHIFSLTANLMVFVYIGGKNVLITNPRDIALFIRLIKKTKLTVITGVNTLFNGLLDNPTFKEIDFSHLRCALGGGMAVQGAVAQRWYEATGHVLAEGYGLTECSPAVTLTLFDATQFTGSIGLPMSSTEVSIRDDDGIELPVGVEGELCIRGPQVMRGYWHRPQETAQAFYPDRWFRTGDLVKMDEKGFIYLLERKKDMIIVSGFNVYPTEVEEVLAAHPRIAEVAVIGVASGESNEQVKAVIVPRDPNLTAEEVIAYARTQLIGYKVPKIVEFTTELPKSTVGKILRRALR